MAQPPKSQQNSVELENEQLLESIMLDPCFDKGERLRNIPLFLRQKDLAHILFMNDIYQKIINVSGYIAEFGLMWGRNLNLFHALRETYEPLNHTRHLIGFDTFKGFIETEKQDLGHGGPEMYQAGAYSVPEGQKEFLDNILSSQTSISHLSHMRRHELVEGDVTQTFSDYLTRNTHAYFALCYFDLDLYRPTKELLELLKTRITKGTILVFDEALNPDYPGETQAIAETLGLQNISLQRSPYSGWKTFCIVE